MNKARFSFYPVVQAAAVFARGHESIADFDPAVPDGLYKQNLMDKIIS